MTVGSAAAVFILGAGVSLATSWLLVTRLERVGERLGFSEASLGMVAALAADTPEITASITAIAHHQQTVGAGVVLGSNADLSHFQEQPFSGILALAGETPTDAGTVDASASPDQQFLYVQTGADGIVDEFQVGSGGSLTSIGSVTVPGAVGGEGVAAL